MRVFVTGATGFIGSAVVAELIGAGHQVIGLARSNEGESSLAALGADVQRGDLVDLEALRTGANSSDGVIHCAFIHDFSKFKENCEIDRRAIEVIGEALAGSNKPLIVSAGIFPTPGRPTTEDDLYPTNSPLPRVSESAALNLLSQGVKVSVMRLPQVHDPIKQGLVSYLIAIARDKGVSAYVGEGLNHWPAAHRLSVATLYRLVLEKGVAGAKYHAVAEEGVTLRDIAEVVGRVLKIPVVSKSPAEAAEHFGILAHFVAMDGAASSLLTQTRLGWNPSGPSLIEDLEKGEYV